MRVRLWCVGLGVVCRTGLSDGAVWHFVATMLCSLPSATQLQCRSSDDDIDVALNDMVVAAPSPDGDSTHMDVPTQCQQRWPLHCWRNQSAAKAYQALSQWCLQREPSYGGDFVAKCTHLRHQGGSGCRKHRTGNAGQVLAKGQPLGWLTAWLQSSHLYPTSQEHKAPTACLSTLEERLCARELLKTIGGDAAHLLALERSMREDEGSEPEQQPWDVKNKFNWNGGASRSICVCDVWAAVAVVIPLECGVHESVLAVVWPMRDAFFGMTQFLSCALLAIKIETHFATFPLAVWNWTACLPHLCRIFAASLPHLCRIFAFLLWRIFAASLPHLCRIFGCIFCFQGCFATSRVPSFRALVDPGRTCWLLATPGFTELHFPKCPSSKTPIGELSL